MNTILLSYAAYAVVSIAMTVWVARTLYRNGRIFLIDAFGGNNEMAASVNHLLVVGFYLINLGFILLFLKIGLHPETVVQGVEYLASKLGVVMLVLGAMHFFNMVNFNNMRRKGAAKAAQLNPPPLYQR
jgi:hypothetical protein